MTSKGKRYNQDFKSDNLKLTQQEKRSVASIVTDFGVSEQMVRNSNPTPTSLNVKYIKK